MNAPHISVPSTDTASVPDTLARILADKAREVAERMEVTPQWSLVTPGGTSLDASSAMAMIASNLRCRAAFSRANFSATASRTAPVAVVPSIAANSLASAISAASLMFSWPMAHLEKELRG